MSFENRMLSGAVFLLGLLAGTGWAATPKAETEPRAFSIYPLGNQPGASYDAQIRGVKLQDAQALYQLKGCLASGSPFVFGFTVYDSFESPAVAQSGHLQMPTANEQQIGGHAVLAVGYDESQQVFVIRNSDNSDLCVTTPSASTTLAMCRSTAIAELTRLASARSPQ